MREVNGEEVGGEKGERDGQIIETLVSVWCLSPDSSKLEQVVLPSCVLLHNCVHSSVGLTSFPGCSPRVNEKSLFCSASDRKLGGAWERGQCRVVYSSVCTI